MLAAKVVKRPALVLTPIVVALMGNVAAIHGAVTVARAQAVAGEATMVTMVVRSSAFEPGGPIPRKYTKEGEDVSPSLEWSGVPAGTKEFALISDDPDAPRAHPWVHWVAYKIPADTTRLPEGTRSGFVEGKNDFGELGYGGPMPPPGHGVHHYHFKVYALGAPIDGEPGKKKGELLGAMQGHVLATGELVGTYERK